MRGVERGVRGRKGGVSALLLPDGVPAPLSRLCSTSSHPPSNPLTSDQNILDEHDLGLILVHLLTDHHIHDHLGQHHLPETKPSNRPTSHQTIFDLKWHYREKSFCGRGTCLNIFVRKINENLFYFYPDLQRGVCNMDWYSLYVTIVASHWKHWNTNLWIDWYTFNHCSTLL